MRLRRWITSLKVSRNNGFKRSSEKRKKNICVFLSADMPRWAKCCVELRQKYIRQLRSNTSGINISQEDVLQLVSLCEMMHRIIIIVSSCNREDSGGFHPELFQYQPIQTVIKNAGKASIIGLSHWESFKWGIWCWRCLAEMKNVTGGGQRSTHPLHLCSSWSGSLSTCVKCLQTHFLSSRKVR